MILNLCLRVREKLTKGYRSNIPQLTPANLLSLIPSQESYGVPLDVRWLSLEQMSIVHLDSELLGIVHRICRNYVTCDAECIRTRHIFLMMSKIELCFSL